ncbi:MAG: EAL domain-containing protein [Pseudomonadota bacterium]
MGKGAANWLNRGALYALALLALLFCASAHARPLPIDYLCTSAPFFNASSAPTSNWQHADEGVMLMQAQFDTCWMRLSKLPKAGEQLTIKNGWANVVLFDSRGNLLAQGNRIGERSHATISANYVIFQHDPDLNAPMYVRVFPRSQGLAIPARVVAEAQIGPALLDAGSRQTNISLAVASAVLVVAFFSAAFSFVMRDGAYALMSGYLLLSVVIRVFNPFEPLIFELTPNFDYARLVARLMYPLINAVWMLAYARVADFGVHAPRINRLCQVTALLYLLEIPFWLADGNLASTINCALIIFTTYPLLFSGCWIAWRKGSAAAGILLLSNLMLAVFWAPSQLYQVWPSAALLNFINSSAQLGSLSSSLGVASDLLMPLLFCVALAMRTANLKQTAMRLMSYDALTGMPNRENIRRMGDALLARNDKLAVLVLNIDRFRAINGALGPEIGDQLLVVTGTRVAAIKDAQVGRLHADQFCLLWPDMNTLHSLRQRIEHDFSHPVDVHGQMVDLTLSIGVATASAMPATMAQLLRRAETALDAGRALHLEWMEYRAELESDLRADLGLLSELSRAIEKGELRMYLQPKVRLADGAVNSAEALVRWQHPRRGSVPPVEFVPFAEQTGRIHLITQWMLGEAMRLCTKLRAEGSPLQISVNISTADLAKAGFVQGVIALGEEIGVLPDDIRLEVTESGAMQDPASALLIMHALRNAGFTLSIDDFGTGYSSLAYLQKMPVAELKIDRSFVRDVVAGSDGAVLLESTIELGHRLGLSVVAEGAETRDEWDVLQALGCDYVQGYFIAKPMPATDFLGWRANHPVFQAIQVKSAVD